MINKYIQKSLQKYFYIIFILIFLSLFLVPFAYSFEGIKTISHSEKFYSFNKIPIFVCSENIDHNSVKNSIYCFDDFKTSFLDSELWNQTCVISVYDASSPHCSRVRIISDFKTLDSTERIREIQEIEIEQMILVPKNILNKQRWDGGFENPINTAVAIWLLSDFGDIYESEIENALEWLKVNRNNYDKCWPSSSCNAYETAVVMAYLTLAGLNDTNKIYYDGRIWLESHQNFLPNENWGVQIKSNNDNNNCTLQIGNSVNRIPEFNKSIEKFFLFRPDYNMRINLSCDYRIDFSVLNERNLSIFSSSNSRDVRYIFPSGACWSSQQWRHCSDLISVYATIVNLSKNRKDAALNYLKSSLRLSSFIGEYLSTTDRILHSALYYHYLDPKPSVAQYLVFEQNNDGSFGKGEIHEVVIRTLHVVNSLRSQNLPFTQEPISDSLRWLFSKNPLNGFNNVLADTLVYYTLKKDDISTLFYENDIIIIDDDLEILFSNPFDKTYNVTYKLDDSLKNLIEIKMDSVLKPYSYLNININKKEINAGIHTGFLKIYDFKDKNINFSDQNLTDEEKYGDLDKIFFVPIKITEDPFLDFKIPKIMTVLGSRGSIKIDEIHTNGNFNCQIELDEIEGNEFEINYNDQFKEFEINILDAERRTIITNVKFICNSIDFNQFNLNKTIIKNFEITIEQYPHKIIEIMDEEITINRRRGVQTLTIRNLIGEEINVNIVLGDLAFGFIVLEKEKLTIPPYDDVSIKIFNTIENKMNISFSDTISVISIDQKTSVPLVVDIVYVPFFKSKLFRIIVSTLILLITLFLLKLIYYYSDDIKKSSSDYSKKTKLFFSNNIKMIKKHLPQSIKEKLHIEEEQEFDENEQIVKEAPVDHSGVESLIKIMMSLNHDEKDIIKRLKKEGLDDEEISESLKSVNEELAIKNEIEREESVIKVIKKMDEDSDTIRSLLKQSGFSDEQINNAFEEIEEELAEKEKSLQDTLSKFKEPEEEVEETSLVDIEKSKSKDE